MYPNTDIIKKQFLQGLCISVVFVALKQCIFCGTKITKQNHRNPFCVQIVILYYFLIYVLYYKKYINRNCENA